MKDTDFIVALEHIPPEGLRLSAAVEDAAAVGMDMAVPQGGPMRVDLELTLVDRRVLVKGDIEGVVRLSCSRCLREYLHPLRTAFETLLQGGEGWTVAGDHELTADEAEVGTLTGGTVDLRSIVAEQVHLSLPVKPLCLEGCEGLCPRCGKDLNEEACACELQKDDPRWEALRKLRA